MPVDLTLRSLVVDLTYCCGGTHALRSGTWETVVTSECHGVATSLCYNRRYVPASHGRGVSAFVAANALVRASTVARGCARQ